ncbi:MAG TPA: hypothetical protein VGT24_00620 [Candidatus Acidoferrales bacterium]|nr:hypothetical protein [Candidatus Acidoferrales bacterium]
MNRGGQPVTDFAAPPNIPKGSGHSRTLYTSNALDQSNFIF